MELAQLETLNSSKPVFFLFFEGGIITVISIIECQGIGINRTIRVNRTISAVKFCRRIRIPLE